MLQVRATRLAPRLWGAASVLLGCSLCLGLFTNWRWSSHLANALHPVLTVVLGMFVWFRWRRRKPRAERVPWWCVVPSLAAGTLALLGPIVMLIPPFTLAAFFTVSEIASEKIVQREPSPDGKWAAVVRYRPVGAYASGAGHVLIGVRPRSLPVIERHVVGPLSTDRADSSSFVRWASPTRLHLEEQAIEVDVAGTRLGAPLAFTLAKALADQFLPELTKRIGWRFAEEGSFAEASACAGWQVWGIRVGMTVDELRRIDPDFEYGRPDSRHDVHLWKAVVWDARQRDQEEAPELVQWRFGYAGTVITDGTWASSRVIGLRLSAGAIPVKDDGEPVRDVPVLKRIGESWGPAQYSFELHVPMPVAERGSPSIQHAEVWIDESCRRLARITRGDGPFSTEEDPRARGTYRYHTIELYDLKAPGISVEDFTPKPAP